MAIEGIVASKKSDWMRNGSQRRHGLLSRRVELFASVFFLFGEEEFESSPELYENSRRKRSSDCVKQMLVSWSL